MKNSSNRLIFPTFVCMEGSADKIFEVLKRYWGFTEFRPVQERIIRSAMAGRDTLALMPTGGGKSLTYQVPGLAQPGLCIVVTPLIALMKDQVDRLRARRIPAVAIHSGLSPRQIDIPSCEIGRPSGRGRQPSELIRGIQYVSPTALSLRTPLCRQ